ncbi:MAG: hypothetical protein QOF92_1759 [Pseudonocardiales bacterium]|nr:hypothetical protein [Pseudonocardiales bacterium]
MATTQNEVANRKEAEQSAEAPAVVGPVVTVMAPVERLIAADELPGRVVILDRARRPQMLACSLQRS